MEDILGLSDHLDMKSKYGNGPQIPPLVHWIATCRIHKVLLKITLSRLLYIPKYIGVHFRLLDYHDIKLDYQNGPQKLPQLTGIPKRSDMCTCNKNNPINNCVTLQKTHRIFYGLMFTLTYS